MLNSSQKVTIKNTVIKCDNITITNEINADTQIFNTMSNIEKLNFKTFLKSSMPTLIENAVEQTNKDLNLFQTNVDIKDTTIKEKLVADLSTLISNKTQQIFNADISQLLTQEIHIEDSTIECDGDFLAINTISVKNLVINVMEDIQITEILKEIAVSSETTVKNTSIQSNEGIDIAEILGMAALLAMLVMLLPIVMSAGVAAKLMSIPKMFMRKKKDGTKASQARTDNISIHLMN